MKSAEFVHLHTHSQYSLLDGACKLDDVIAIAKERKMPALAITDHGNMFGAVEFYQKAIAAGVKPIIGMEAYISHGAMTNKKPHEKYPDGGFHLVILAKNQAGYQNLMKIATAGYLEGFYHRPRVDKDYLRAHSEGLIATSACPQGEVNWNLLRGYYAEALAAANTYSEIFGVGNFYLEMQDHGLDIEKKLIPEIAKLHDDTKLPLVCSNDCHYLREQDAKAHDALLCIQTGKLVSDEKRMRYNTDQIYFKSQKQMVELFGEFPEAAENTLRIAEECNVQFDFSKMHLPHFPIPKPFVDADEFLRDLTVKGAEERYGGSIDDEANIAVKERLDYELSVIKRLGYAGYFLITKDFIDYSRSINVRVGPGRGSAAGSIVSYTLKITSIDPLKYSLLFERFLNPDRVSMPDIDIDFADRGREKIIEYVIEKYGSENVTQIITFGTMAARGVLRDVGRVLSIPYTEVDKIAKMVPFAADMTLKRALKENPDIQKLADTDARVATLLDYGQRLEGLTRHASTHAAGVVIAPSALTNYVPLFKGSKNEITTQFDMKCVEKIGLLKMDFLGLRTLTVIDDALKMIEANHGVTV
ncbi:DNA polymerase III subunit alpha, partial [bacterium AH-315-J21]|nr:DNA polymerase III subunit alpha [bacterium AH-315-J21]